MLRRRFRIVKRKSLEPARIDYIIEYRVLRVLWWAKLDCVRAPKGDSLQLLEATEFSSVDEAEGYLRAIYTKRQGAVRRRVMKHVRV